MDDAGIDALRDAIKNMHGCDSKWVASVPVTETFLGDVVWDGEVQVRGSTPAGLVPAGASHSHPVPYGCA